MTDFCVILRRNQTKALSSSVSGNLFWKTESRENNKKGLALFFCHRNEVHISLIKRIFWDSSSQTKFRQIVTNDTQNEKKKRICRLRANNNWRTELTVTLISGKCTVPEEFGEYPLLQFLSRKLSRSSMSFFSRKTVDNWKRLQAKPNGKTRRSPEES